MSTHQSLVCKSVSTKEGKKRFIKGNPGWNHIARFMANQAILNNDIIIGQQRQHGTNYMSTSLSWIYIPHPPIAIYISL